MNTLEMLVGKTLLRVSQGEWEKGATKNKESIAYGGVFGQNRDTVTFHCTDGDYTFLADGDCCSRTYIDSIEGPTSGKILGVEEPSWGGTESEPGDDCTQFYKASFKIEGQGHLDITYRNESNGYYGGSLEFLYSTPAS